MNEMNTNGPVKRLQRTDNGKIIAGVCSGVGEYIGVDPNILRLALAVASFFGGLGFGVYAVAWLLLPEKDKDTSIVQDLLDKKKDGQAWQDAAKAKWHDVQSSWSRPGRSGDDAQNPYGSQQPYGDYGQHPYGQQAPYGQAPATDPAARPEDRPQS
ncbi:PspC domain-containing protein [Sphaerimonospora sp. CA-214678]|uniref:PspC domain-containing protein n=1 Tax=Sphaerimonospora sp. CA-214678 TaxID=3240029 RepID=UPI003D8B2B4C